MKKLMPAILVAALTISAGANAETYVCEIEPKGNGAWIPTSLAIDYNEKTGDVIVNDEFILYYNKKPLAGSVAANNAKRITFKWTLPEVRNESGQTALRFNFRASYIKRTHKMTVTSQPAGYANNFRGYGTCTIK